MMKIQLLCNLPIGKEHGMAKDRVLEVIRVQERERGRGGRDRAGWWVMGDAGKEVRVFRYEAKEIE